MQLNIYRVILWRVVEEERWTQSRKWSKKVTVLCPLTVLCPWLVYSTVGFRAEIYEVDFGNPRWFGDFLKSRFSSKSTVQNIRSLRFVLAWFSFSVGRLFYKTNHRTWKHGPGIDKIWMRNISAVKRKSTSMWKSNRPFFVEFFSSCDVDFLDEINVARTNFVMHARKTEKGNPQINVDFRNPLRIFRP